MPTYEVIIEEAASGTFRAEAPTADEAAEAARRSYKAGELVLEPGDPLGAKMCVVGGRSVRPLGGRVSGPKSRRYVKSNDAGAWACAWRMAQGLYAARCGDARGVRSSSGPFYLLIRK